MSVVSPSHTFVALEEIGKRLSPELQQLTLACDPSDYCEVYSEAEYAEIYAPSATCAARLATRLRRR